MSTENLTRIEIRDLSLEEGGIIAGFFNDHWRPNHIFYTNQDMLLWQYYKNPHVRQFTDGLAFKAAFLESSLVGVFGYIPFVFNNYGKREYGCSLSAWWVAPDHRRGPLGIRLLNSIQYQMGFRTCVAAMNTAIAENIYARMGWSVVSNIPRMLLPLNTQRMLDLLIAKDCSAMQSYWSRNPDKTNVHMESAIPKKEMQVSQVSHPNRLYDFDWDNHFWKDIAPAYMGPAKEVEYLIWRYKAIPLFQYQMLLAHQNNKPLGLLVYRCERVKDSDALVIRVVDMIGDSGNLTCLLDALIDVSKKQDAVLIDFFSTQPIYDALLISKGFDPVMQNKGQEYTYPYLFQPLDCTHTCLNTAWWIEGLQKSSIDNRNAMMLMKGDHEFDRPN
jgi:hypothetical protein